MPLQVVNYVRRPDPVHAVFVTSDNLQEVAEWCSGTVQNVTHTSPHVLIAPIDIKSARTRRKTRAYPGDVIAKNKDGGFKVYPKNSFDQIFKLVEPLNAPFAQKKNFYDGKKDRMWMLVQQHLQKTYIEQAERASRNMAYQIDRMARHSGREIASLLDVSEHAMTIETFVYKALEELTAQVQFRENPDLAKLSSVDAGTLMHEYYHV